MSCPVIVSPGLTRQAFNLPSYEPDYHGRDLESGDWVIADHEHPAFGKSAYQFARTEQGQPWVTNDGKCLLCNKNAPWNHFSGMGHASKLKLEYDPMDQLFKLEHPGHLLQMSQEQAKQYKQKFIKGLMDRGMSHQEIKRRIKEATRKNPDQIEANRFRHYLLHTDSSSEAGSAAAGDSEQEPQPKRIRGSASQNGRQSDHGHQGTSASGGTIQFDLSMDPHFQAWLTNFQAWQASLTNVMRLVDSHGGEICELNKKVRALMTWASDPYDESTSSATPQNLIPPMPYHGAAPQFPSGQAGSRHPQHQQPPPAANYLPPQPPGSRHSQHQQPPPAANSLPPHPMTFQDGVQAKMPPRIRPPTFLRPPSPPPSGARSVRGDSNAASGATATALAPETFLQMPVAGFQGMPPPADQGTPPPAHPRQNSSNAPRFKPFIPP